LEGLVHVRQTGHRLKRVGLNAVISGLSAKKFLLRCNRLEVLFQCESMMMLKKARTIALVATLMGSSYICGAVSAESHLDSSITLLRSSIKEAIQCGGGGPDGSGCKGPRGEAIKLMNRALDLLNASR
jgi:hypothetical protein